MRFVRISLSSSGDKDVVSLQFYFSSRKGSTHYTSDEEKLLFLLFLVSKLLFFSFMNLLYLQSFFRSTFIGLINFASVIFPKK